MISKAPAVGAPTRSPPVRSSAPATPSQAPTPDIYAGCDAPILPTRNQLKPPSYFQTDEQTRAAMEALATKYPTLAKVENIGPSYETTQGRANRNLWMIRLGKQDQGNPKILFLGGIHAREIANPALLMRWATQALSTYATDPKMKALLDSHEIDIVPIANPDGHAVIEQGYTRGDESEIDQRKNTDGPGGDGVDLNRNFDDHWNLDGGSSSDPTDETYRGKSPASEPETQAIQTLMAKEKYQLMIDFHSFSQLVLYPVGYTNKPPPDAAALKKIADHIASFNGYTAEQSSQLYLNNGTTIDYEYDKFHTPAYCIETGTTFWPNDQQFEEIWRKNAPAISYLAQAPSELAAPQVD